MCFASSTTHRRRNFSLLLRWSERKKSDGRGVASDVSKIAKIFVAKNRVAKIWAI
jgi:hypothetical protein